MQSGHVNFLSILVSAAVYFILGALWYSKALFGKAWMKDIGKTEEQLKEGFSPLAFVWSFIWSFIATYAIARLMVWTGGSTVRDGFLIGLLTAVCFIVAPMVINNLFERRSKTLLTINAAYHSLALILAGIIIGAWR